jgi:hypothetical protein
VADWRQQLHAAQDALAASPRQAWLAQMRVRLYRFLLRCYGKANWRTSPAPRTRDEAVFDQPEARFLHGKPAKTPGKIQAVLKSVADAHGPIESGRYTREAAHSFVPIAAESPQIDTLRVFAALRREGIEARHVVRDCKDVVEVLATDFYRAQWLLDGLPAHRFARKRRKSIGPELVSSFGVALAIAPFVGMLATLACGSTAAARPELVATVFCSVSVGWVVVATTYSTCQAMVRERRARRPEVHLDD